MDTYPDPTSEALARAGQAAAMAVVIAEAALVLRNQRETERMLRQQQADAIERAQVAARRATDRTLWWPALGRDWLRAADTRDLLTAWAAAQPWVRTDPLAHVASTRTEQQLSLRHPDAMREYQTARAEGLGPADAMRRAAPHFRGTLAIDRPRGESAMPPAPSAPDTPLTPTVTTPGKPITITTLSPHR